jgi:adenylate cyclase
MNKVLIVDDEDDLEVLIRQKLRKQIRDGKYDLIFAKDGLAALDMIKSDPEIMTVLSDINMPKLDGLSLLLHVKAHNPLIKTIIVSAYGDMENIRTAMNRGAYDFLTKPINFEDLEITIDKTFEYIIQLQNTLQAIRENNIMKMYVDPSVLEYMTRSEIALDFSANETIEASVAFIDICGFTSIAEQESPDIVVQLLNKYFDLIVKHIITADGYVDKFMGDAVMAVFRGENHAQRAAEASLAVMQEIAQAQDDLQKQVGYQPQVSIGINSGEMVSGNIGAISLKRLDYTVIGDVVNTAQRIQAHANPGEVLLGENTYQQLAHAFKCQRKEDAVVKNKTKPIVVYQVLG